MRRAAVGPFGEICFTEDDRAGGAKSLGDGGIFRRSEAEHGEGAGGGGHFVGGAEVVLDEDGDAVERAAEAFGRLFGVKSGGDGEGVGIEFDDGI